jgi:hypothetical protein
MWTRRGLLSPWPDRCKLAAATSTEEHDCCVSVRTVYECHHLILISYNEYGGVIRTRPRRPGRRTDAPTTDTPSALVTLLVAFAV